MHMPEKRLPIHQETRRNPPGVRGRKGEEGYLFVEEGSKVENGLATMFGGAGGRGATAGLVEE